MFADSGGRCANPECLSYLFVDLPMSGSVHFGEIAHVIAASSEGPRGVPDQSPESLGHWDNLLLLCANCHTVIDRAPDDHPIELIQRWKSEHLAKVELGLGVHAVQGRPDARALVEPLQLQNRRIHETRGPDNEYRFDPDSEQARMWKHDMLEYILPNHRSILRVIDANRSLLQPQEVELVETYRIHVRDLVARHIDKEEGIVSVRYPLEMDLIYAD